MISTFLFSMALAASYVLGLVNPDARSITKNLPRKIAERSDFLEFFWSADTPSPSATYDAHYSDTSDWFELASDDAGIELSSSGDKVGYRLPGDDSSAIVYTLYSTSKAMVELNILTGDSDDGPEVEISGTLSAFYASTTASTYERLNSDVWDSDVLTTIVLNKTVTAQNVDCDSGMVITITTLDANGIVLVYTGTDNISAPVPTALPANVTVTNENNATAVLVYNGIEPILARFGSGNVPVPQASLVATVQYCSD